MDSSVCPSLGMTGFRVAWRPQPQALLSFLIRSISLQTKIFHTQADIQAKLFGVASYEFWLLFEVIPK